MTEPSTALFIVRRHMDLDNLLSVRRLFQSPVSRRFISEIVHGGVSGSILDGYAQFVFSRLARTGARSTREGTMAS